MRSDITPPHHLEQSQTRHQQLLDMLVDVRYTLFGEDGQWQATHHTAAVATLTGYPPHAFNTDPRLWFNLLSSADKAYVEEQLLQLQQKGTIPPFQHRLRHKDGSNRWIRETIVPRDDDQGRTVAYDGLVQDITVQKRAERQAIRTERLAMLGQLAASLAHEINNPLQAIQANLDLVLDFPLDAQKTNETLEVIRQEIVRLKSISQRMLSYAQPKKENVQEVFVTDILDQVLFLTRKQLEQHHISLTTTFQEMPPVRVVPAQLLQVFLNLVLNAIDAVPPRQGRLDVSTMAGKDCIIVSFFNNGPPIPAESLPHLFEAFFTTKPEGNGLGLWISDLIIQNYYGCLAAKNVEDGVCFTVTLPTASKSSSLY